MAAVNWDAPSTGVVTDPNPALELENGQGGALVATAIGAAVVAQSTNAEAVVGETTRTVAGRFTSEEWLGVVARAPKAMAVIGVNQAGTAAVSGLNAVDPTKPGAVANPLGYGVFGGTNRFAAIGTAGVAVGLRSVGVHGEAKSGVGVHGRGTAAGVEGVASEGFGVSGVTFSDRAAGVFGSGVGQSSGVRGEAVAGPGVQAHASAGPGVEASSEQAHGVNAAAKAANAAGVFGRNDNGSGVGVDGFSEFGTAVRGVSNGPIAIKAIANAGRAIDAESNSTVHPTIRSVALGGPAVRALSLAGPGVDAFGVTGVVGNSGWAPDPTNPSVGAGVSGGTFGATGVCGITGIGIGVRGIGHPLLKAWAGVFDGDVVVNGLVFKYASLFSIDHPLDPKRKTLNHAAVEAPEYKTFYDGVATLDGRGRARVRLPRWFEALNAREALRYQLTPLGAPAPDLHVASGVNDGAFVIAGGQAGQRVCWQLTGVRRDAWARANPLVVEQSKRGTRPRPTSPSLAEIKRLTAEINRRAAAARADAARARVRKPRRMPDAIRSPEKVPRPKDSRLTEAVTQMIDAAAPGRGRGPAVRPRRRR